MTPQELACKSASQLFAFCRGPFLFAFGRLSPSAAAMQLREWPFLLSAQLGMSLPTSERMSCDWLAWLIPWSVSAC